MGYNISIGNAVPEHSKEYGDLYAAWRVESAIHDDAPTFHNDNMTGKSNSRYPSYTAWAGFCRAVGLDGLFYGDGSLLDPHPGCNILTKEHHDRVANVLALYKRTKPPGFPSDPVFDKDKGEHIPAPDAEDYDPMLARLIWLEYWVRWAVENCETPAIANS